ncbi:MAG TPA: PIG-L family deacetylase [Solirubrobacteraceae bacterium]|nr:PIG-L family deacetylase [Solirubrobacteraceae bacterium]
MPRALRRRSQARLQKREESDFRTLLRTDSGAPELVLSPHWDDAALDCWSLLADDRELAVVNVFGGIPPSGHAGTWEAIAGLQDTAARARGRMAEDERALERLGRTPVNLPLLDAEYRRQMQSGVGLEQLDAALAEAVPSASHVYVPAGIGAHIDHVLVRRYGRLLLRAGMPVSLYAELPYCFFHGWPSWVDGGDAQPPRDVDAYWRSFMTGVPEMPKLRSAVVERLDARAAAAKAEAVGCYELSLNYAARRMLLDPVVLAFEVRWELRLADTRVRAGRAM